jgi:CRISPR-associated endonuclease/helicase Cas3
LRDFCSYGGSLKMIAFRRLLAKNSRNPNAPQSAETLPGHTANVLAAAEALLDETADAQLIAVGLPPETWRERLRRGVLIAAFCHDLGKANDQFQTMIRHQREGSQAIRHEALSLLIFEETALREWLKTALEDKDTLNFLLWAAAGHHRKFPPGEPSMGTGARLSLFLGHSDFRRTLIVGAESIGLDDPPLLTDMNWPLTGHDSPSRHLTQLRVRAAVYWDVCTDEQRRFLAVVKACVIAADVAGSALPKTGKKIALWIREALRRRPTSEHMQKIVADRLQGQSPRPFQNALGATKTRVVLAQAGCGSGKTIGAYLWAAQRAPGQHLFFSYPTTGTATEGFRDYLIDPTLDAQLVHGRASVDLDLLGVDDDGERTDSLAALDVWSTLITSCTVDTVLGLIQNHRRGLYAWPAMAEAAFVFDEIHAYDDRLFAALLRFLTSCRGLPCLLMTASLPEARRAALEETLRGLGETLDTVTGPADLEALPRYQRLVSDDAWSVVEQTLNESGKVLWVVNTVDRALKLVDEAKTRGLAPLVYHSRFRYEDRVRQHGRVISAFRAEGPVLAIATQVAEMSLDLSADLLVTDMAPIAALIQRLGRLNRRATPTNLIPPKPFLVVEPGTEAPYKAQDHPNPFAPARKWLELLGMAPLSQTDLAQAWVSLEEGDTLRPLESAWLDGGFETTPRHLRESMPGLMVMLEQDAAAVERGEVDPIRVRVPMNPPRDEAWKTWREVAFARVPPPEHITYNPERGAQWKHR